MYNETGKKYDFQRYYFRSNYFEEQDKKQENENKGNSESSSQNEESELSDSQEDGANARHLSKPRKGKAQKDSDSDRKD